MNIVKNFPRAEEIRELTPNGLQLYDFEQKLKSLRKRILTAAVDGETEVKISNICDEIKSFLSEKGYVVTKKHDNLYTISWVKNRSKSNLNPVNVNINVNKKNFQTGGIIEWDKIFNELKI